MVTKVKEMQRIIQLYKDETGKKEVCMHDVAAFARTKGWPLPKPKSPLEVLSKEFSKAAREETRRDPKTGTMYRANHAISETQGQLQFTYWVDIDTAPRVKMEMALTQRRDQMIGDGYQLTVDTDHWNRMHPRSKPIQMPLDFTGEVSAKLVGVE